MCKPLAPIAGALLLGALGCYAPLMSLSERSAIEQELTSAAFERTVAKLDLEALDRDSAYSLELALPERSDAALVRARLEERLAREGVRLVAPADPAAPVLRAVVPFVGADVHATLLGLPFVVPGLPVALGDISLYRSTRIVGRARVELSVRRGSLLESVADAEGSRHYRNFTLLTFVGPFRLTDLEQGRPPGQEERRSWELWRED